MHAKTKKKQDGASADHQSLGTGILPYKYSIAITPNFKTFRYDGSEAIDLNVLSSTKEISLNASELEVRRASVISGNTEQSATIKENRDEQKITLVLKRPVKGKAQIKMKFSGTNNDGMYGFYRSRYKQNGKQSYSLSSQFEAADARKAFPCFDEPAFKARFSVSFVIDKGMHAISNMPPSQVIDAGKGKKEVRFEETPPMSTYLLYLGVGKYDIIKSMCGNTEVSVITSPGNKQMAKIPLTYAKAFLKFYEHYFGIKFPLPKIDFIAVPDFAAGAMENWGAITFRESALLLDGKSSVALRQRVAEVIAHELAHQWFGDLVTMRWWNDLWLNESFATFMATKAMDSVFPEWKVKVKYKDDVIATAQAADQLKSTHPISVHVDSPAQIDQLFDRISYEKGGSVLNMLEDYVSPKIFREGLHRYLKAHSYSNATKSDLWGAIDEVSREKHMKLKVNEVASKWIDTPGYPLIWARRGRDCVELKQERYLLIQSKMTSPTWPIPLSYSVSGKERKLLMESKSVKIAAGGDDWIKINQGQNGFYRVYYSKEDTERLGSLISARRIGDVDAWGIAHDLFSKSRSGRSRIAEYLDFVSAYCMNVGYPANSDILSSLSWINNTLHPIGSAQAKELLLRYSGNVLDKLGWNRDPKESSFDTTMRSQAIISSGLAGNQRTLDTASRMFYSSMREGKEIEPNIKGAVYALAAWSEGEAAYNLLRKKFASEKLPEESLRILRAMGMFSSPELLRKAMDFSMSNDVRIQDSYLIPAIASSNPFARGIILEWTERNWPRLKEMYASGTHMLGRYLENLSCLNTREDMAEVKRFFNSKENFREDIVQSMSHAIELIESNIRFLETNR